MTARLTRLRIAGFKSFAEPVSLDILPGLTGVVGPNGCGKSNVVEALRWAMGETSARSLRGGDMDDVIFAGTTARASRNLAEVTITLEPADGEEGALPQPFEAETELQITRRIERGAGSHFRANGRELRARDVQTLYADLASGARSSGMVSQGRVSQLVNAKPEERRQVLEEAAGITGLHARRHEAELKLRAAEQNVLRAEDARAQLETARDNLRKAARQAARYRNISGLIRAAEADHLAVLHAQAQNALHQAETASAEARAATEAAAEEVGISGDAFAEAEAAIPAPREAEALARSTLERRRVEAESLAAESARVSREAAEAEARLLDLEADCAAANRAQADAQASVARLTAEAARLHERLQNLPAERAAATAAHRATRAEAETAQEAADEAAALARENQAQLRQAATALEAAQARAANLRAQHEAATADHAAAEAALVTAEQHQAAEARVAEAAAALATARIALDQAETARAEAQRAHMAARSRAEQAVAQVKAAQIAVAEAAARAAKAHAAFAQAESALHGLDIQRIPPARLAQANEAATQAEAALAQREADLEQAEHAAATAQKMHAEAARHRADAAAARTRAEQILATAEARAQNLAAEVLRAQSALDDAAQDAPTPETLAGAAAAREAAGHALAAQDAAKQRLQAGSARAAQALADARAAAAAAEAEEARLAAEAEGLRAAMGEAAEDHTIFTALTVPEGLEAAFGAALGDAADASLDETAAKFFRPLPETPTNAVLPNHPRFDTLVAAPPALARALQNCLLIGDAEDGDAIQHTLAPGMIAATRSGATWRWDGQVTRAGAPNAASIRLRQSNRLRAVGAARAHAAAAADLARATCEAARQDAATAQTFEHAARTAFAEAEAALRQARETEAALAARAAQAEARRASLSPILQRLLAERDGAAATLQIAADAHKTLANDADAAREEETAGARAKDCTRKLEEARAARAAARAHQTEARQAATRLHDAARDIDSRHAAQQTLRDLTQAEQAAAQQALAQAEAAAAAAPDAAAAQAARQAAEIEEASAKTTETAARQTREAAEQRLDGARAALTALQNAAVQASSRLAALKTLMDRCAADAAEADTAMQAAQTGLAALPDQKALAEAAEQARQKLDAARKKAQDAELARTTLEAEHRQAETGTTLAAHDLAAWQNRLDEAVARGKTLVERRDAARKTHSSLADAPAAIAARAEKSGAALHAAEADHKAAHDRLHAAEQRVRALALARRDAELQVAARRETLVRAEAAFEGAQGALAAILARAAERLGETAILAEPQDCSDDSEERARKKFERLTREREEMGPVNLRAELELEELDQRLSTLEREREELNTAIAKLRGSIGHLNREGRARLEAVFAQVDQHFRTLFTRMMGGGRAHLALTGNEDPLLAGLEIFAEPPGKKLAALSLLSGGEQALTALSLIFAVFRCTPAPISVLDEVDAPLDDANVERFCTLLDDVVRDTGTRFLVVTHHQLTMSRMDRLFGVTMQERGVSRLLSVDLQRATALVEPALQAAE